MLRSRLHGLVLFASCVFALPAHAALERLPPARGPDLGSDILERRRALRCPDELKHPDREPVLLIHGTSVLPDENWGWNYLTSLPENGFDTCTVRLPQRALGDIQVASEYVVYAIKAIHQRTGRRVDILGHSQGGLEPRWALKWWPELREMVDDVVTLGTPHHGTVAASMLAPLPCASPACLQMRIGSDFLRSLNDGDETPGDVSYTSIYSLQDTLVQPSFWKPTSALDGGTNVRVQDVCPLRYITHIGLVWDPVVFDLVVDAFTHEGGADPTRLPEGTCLKVIPRHIDPLYAMRSPVILDGVRGAVIMAPALFEPDLASYTSRRLRSR